MQVQCPLSSGFTVRSKTLSMLCCIKYDIDALVQDCSISNAFALEMLQSCTEPYVCCLLDLNIMLTSLMTHIVFTLQNIIMKTVQTLHPDTYITCDLWNHNMCVLTQTYSYICRMEGVEACFNIMTLIYQYGNSHYVHKMVSHLSYYYNRKSLSWFYIKTGSRLLQLWHSLGIHASHCQMMS